MFWLTVFFTILFIFLLEFVDGFLWIMLGIVAMVFTGVILITFAGGSLSAPTYAEIQRKKAGKLIDAKVITASQCKLQKTAKNEWIIEKFIGMDEAIMEIPKEFNGIPVRIIGPNAFENCVNLESISVPEGVTEIKRYAFYGCMKMREILLPSTLQQIGSSAFRLTALKELSLPKGIKIIEEGVFAGTNLTHVKIPSHVTTIKKDAFYGCRQITEISLSEGVVEIGGNAFKGCIGLQKVTIPKSVKKIGEKAFGKIGYGNLDITMHCYPGSCGLEYARKNNFAYKDVTKK